jgi:hypothetical protein
MPTPEWLTWVGDFIKNVGIPGAIAFFVLWRLNGTLKSLRDSNVEVVVALKALSGNLDQFREGTTEAREKIMDTLGRIERHQGRAV